MWLVSYVPHENSSSEEFCMSAVDEFLLRETYPVAPQMIDQTRKSCIPSQRYCYILYSISEFGWKSTA